MDIAEAYEVLSSEELRGKYDRGEEVFENQGGGELMSTCSNVLLILFDSFILIDKFWSNSWSKFELREPEICSVWFSKLFIFSELCSSLSRVLIWAVIFSELCSFMNCDLLWTVIFSELWSSLNCVLLWTVLFSELWSSLSCVLLWTVFVSELCSFMNCDLLWTVIFSEMCSSLNCLRLWTVFFSELWASHTRFYTLIYYTHVTSVTHSILLSSIGLDIRTRCTLMIKQTNLFIMNHVALVTVLRVYKIVVLINNIHRINLRVWLWTLFKQNSVYEMRQCSILLLLGGGQQRHNPFANQGFHGHPGGGQRRGGGNGGFHFKFG